MEALLQATSNEEMMAWKKLFVFYTLVVDLSEDAKFLYENHWPELHEVKFKELKGLLWNEIRSQNKAIKRRRIA